MSFYVNSSSRSPFQVRHGVGHKVSPNDPEKFVCGASAIAPKLTADSGKGPRPAAAPFTLCQECRSS